MRLLIIFAVVACAAAYTCYIPGYNYYCCKSSNACARSPRYYPYCGYRSYCCRRPTTYACANSRSYDCVYRPPVYKCITVRRPCRTPQKKKISYRSKSDLCASESLHSCRRYRLSYDILEAYNLIKDVDPATPQEYILKGVVNAALGQEQGSREHLKIAQQYFQLVGGSASECDTIPGRQCMASCFFLLKQFDDVLIYLNSVKSYFYNDDCFNFNYAQAKAASGNFKEAEEVFLLINSEKIRNDYVYFSWLARCYIMNKKPRLAWELYLKMDTSGESFSILQLIANDCYKMGQFYYAAKAFDVLERIDSNPEYWEGKRGACVGIFQMILAGHEPRETLREVLMLLRNTANPQVEYIVRTMKKWGKEERLNLQ